MAILDLVYYGNPLSVWLIAILIAAVTIAVLSVFKHLVTRHLAARAERTATDLRDPLADLLGRTGWYFLLALSIAAGAQVLDLPRAPGRLVSTAVVLAVLLQAAVWGNALIAYGMGRYARRTVEEDAAVATTIGAFGFVGKLALWTVIFFVALDNLGVNITALVAGLGVVGIAVALALQNILGDLFASFSIVLDKPFVIGDFIIVDQYLGTVEHIGLKTTRIRSLSGEQIIFPNGDLLASRVRNYKRMSERRVTFTLGVTYETLLEKLAAIPAMIRETIQAQQQARFDRAHFREYGDFALKFEVVYYVLTPDYTTYMDVQQAINLEIYHRFKEAGIEFAYPTQTVYVARGAVAAAG